MNNETVLFSICPIGLTIPLLTSFDFVGPICQAEIGGDTTPTLSFFVDAACTSPTVDQLVDMILDGDLTTSYYNYGPKSMLISGYYAAGGTGFVVVPHSGNSSVLQGFKFATAADNPDLDPTNVSIEGSYTDDSIEMMNGLSWNFIYLGSTGINAYQDPGRSVWGNLQTISNASPFRSYRFIIYDQRVQTMGIQYSEVQLFGYFID